MSFGEIIEKLVIRRAGPVKRASDGERFGRQAEHSFNWYVY
jgi:hypothetical protein